MFDRATDYATSANVKYASGDYTGGVTEQLWTLTAHGLVSGDVVYCLYQSAMGAVAGGIGTRWYVKYKSSSTFELYSDPLLATVSTNTADGSAAFLKGNDIGALVNLAIIPNIIVGAHDFTGGTAEDIDVCATTGVCGVQDGDTIKLLYKSAAGVAGVAVDATAFVKTPTVTYFQHAATSGGSVLDTTADGTNVWLKTS
jgi:hypothetical protein